MSENLFPAHNIIISCPTVLPLQSAQPSLLQCILTSTVCSVWVQGRGIVEIIGWNFLCVRKGFVCSDCYLLFTPCFREIDCFEGSCSFCLQNPIDIFPVCAASHFLSLPVESYKVQFYQERLQKVQTFKQTVALFQILFIVLFQI